MLYLSLFSLILLYLGYRYYAPKLEKNIGINLRRETLALEGNKIQFTNFFSFRKLQFAQFALISGIECLYGGIIGTIYGPLTMIWCVVGTIFMGTVLNYYCGIYPVINKGKYIQSYIRDKYGKIAYFIFNIFLLSAVIVAISSTYITLLNINYYSYNLSLIWIFFIFFSLIICTCSQQLLISIYSLIGGMILLIGIFFICLNVPNLKDYDLEIGKYQLNELKYAYPMLFFVITSGAICGFQGLTSSLIAPSVKNEKHGKGLLITTTIIQAIFVISWNLIILSWKPSYDIIGSLVSKISVPYNVILDAGKGYVGNFGFILIYLLAITLCFAMSGALSRVGRNIIIETNIFGKYTKEIAVILLAILSYLSFKTEMTMYVSVLLCQMVATSLFYIMSLYLKDNDKVYEYTIFPTYILTGACLAYITLSLGKQSAIASILIGLSVTTLLFVMYFRKKRNKN